MRILLIRHGEPDYTTDTLTAEGKVQAELLALRMANYRIRDFYVSPLGRARETAAYTLKRMGREAETLPWLREFWARHTDPETGTSRIVWDMKPRNWTKYPESLDPDRWTEIPPLRGSDAAEVWREVKAGTDELLSRYGMRKDGPVWRAEHNGTDTIALFCHFGISMAVLAYLTDVSPMILWHRILCLPSSLTEMVTEERIPGEVSFRATRIGDITHLEMNRYAPPVHGLYPECYNGIDSTDPTRNGMPMRQAP